MRRELKSRKPRNRKAYTAFYYIAQHIMLDIKLIINEKWGGGMRGKCAALAVIYGVVLLNGSWLPFCFELGIEVLTFCALMMKRIK